MVPDGTVNLSNNIWEQKLGGDRSDAEIVGGFMTEYKDSLRNKSSV